MPFLIIQGMTKNIGRDGSTYQNVPSEWSAIFFVITWGSLISQYIQIIPRTEIKGSDAMRLPNKGNFLETSEMRTMTKAVRPSLIKYQVIEQFAL